MDERAWSLAPDLAELAALAPELDAFLVAGEVGDRPSYVARLVVEEVVRNLLVHAAPADVDETIDVNVTVEPASVIVTITDDRLPFDPTEAPALDTTAPLDERRAGGMGWHLVRSLADELRYERADGRNRLTAVIAR